MKPRLLLLLVLCGFAAAAQGQPVQGQVDAVGFATPAANVIREGQWFPVLVTLRSQGSSLFSGELRLRCIDLDGDHAVFRQTQVAVGSEAGGQKRFWCYGVANQTNEMPTEVEVIGPDGALVMSLPMSSRAETLPNDDLLILDISNPSISSLDRLQTRTWAAGADDPGALRPYYRNIVVARMPAAELPDRWYGLEAVNVVFWDRPDPAALSIPQRDALIEWVRNGGQLILAVGATWNALRKSEFGPLLPLEGEAETIEVRRLDRFAERLGLTAWVGEDLPTPVPLTTAQPVPDAIVMLKDQWSGGVLNVVAMRPVDSGRLVTIAASLRDLVEVRTPRINEVAAGRLYGELLDLNAHSPEYSRKAAESSHFQFSTPQMLYPRLVEPVGFVARTAVFGLIAFLFVAGYIAVATLASWWWLRGRNLTHLSWTVFAVFALAAAAVSLMGASALRGFRDLRSLSILDMQAGSRQARGLCLFGFRSPLRERVDLGLPGDGNFLRPLAKSPLPGTYYVTPARYDGVPARAGLGDVLVRATLKQLEGWWHGEVGGAIRADLAVGDDGRLTPGSWVANDLPYELEGGLLLFLDPRAGEPAENPRLFRAAGLTQPHPLRDSSIDDDVAYVPPAWNVLALYLPPIPAGKQIGALGQTHYRDVDRALADWLRGGPPRKRSKLPQPARLRTLWDEHQAWAGVGSPLGPRGDWLQSALFASTRNYYLACAGSDDKFASLGQSISTARMHDLDLTHWLMRGQAVLLAWAADPGPARLHRDGQPLDGYRGRTLYRVRIPIREVGGTAGAGASGVLE